MRGSGHYRVWEEEGAFKGVFLLSSQILLKRISTKSYGRFRGWRGLNSKKIQKYFVEILFKRSTLKSYEIYKASIPYLYPNPGKNASLKCLTSILSPGFPKTDTISNRISQSCPIDRI